MVICTSGRKESLNETINSLQAQTYNNFEVVLVTEKGHLSECRQKGLEMASGEIVSLIDDDVICSPRWLEHIVNTFNSDSEIVGVTGPTTIPENYRSHRDLFKYKFFTKLYELLFTNNTKPSHLAKSGSPSLLSNYEWCKYEGEVEYLEACNFSCRRSVAIGVGGFSKEYKRTAEWCEVDLALKLGKKGVLWFNKEAGLEHRPSQAGIYKERLDTSHRWENFMIFQKRWIKPCFSSWAYKKFMWLYFKLKGAGLC